MHGNRVAPTPSQKNIIPLPPPPEGAAGSADGVRGDVPGAAAAAGAGCGRRLGRPPPRRHRPRPRPLRGGRGQAARGAGVSVSGGIGPLRPGAQRPVLILGGGGATLHGTLLRHRTSYGSVLRDGGVPPGAVDANPDLAPARGAPHLWAEGGGLLLLPGVPSDRPPLCLFGSKWE